MKRIKPVKPIKHENLAVFVGRFQPFHTGHLSIVTEILSEYDRMILVIGSAEKYGTEENPWTLQEREAIIRASLSLDIQERIDIVWLDDTADDDVWCENLIQILQHWTFNIEHVTLFTGNEWVRSICEKHGIHTHWIENYAVDISGTRIRQMMKNGDDVTPWTVVMG